MTPTVPPLLRWLGLACCESGYSGVVPSGPECLGSGWPRPDTPGSSFSPEWRPVSPLDHRGIAMVLYYPSDGSEPWLSRDHPLGHLWVRDLLDAVAHSHLTPEAIAEQVALGHVRPSLVYQSSTVRGTATAASPGAPTRSGLRRVSSAIPPKADGALAPMLGCCVRQVGRWTRELKGVAAR